MRLSHLQKFIILACYHHSRQMKREGLKVFYNTQKKKPKAELMAKIITGSIESLIDKELLIGFGIRTPHKWFIKEIKLTAKGAREAKRLLGEQMKLPMK